MSLDYESLLWGPTYDVLGVPATLTTAGGTTVELTALNKTAASSFNNGIGVDFQAFRPAALVRMSELTTVDDFADLVGGELLMAGTTWSIKSYERVPSPNGIADGLMRLFLKDDLNV